MRAVGWVRVCGGWRRQLDEERQLQEFSRQKENNQAGEHRKAHNSATSLNDLNCQSFEISNLERN